jgi:enterochelin esterase family protein
MITLPVIILSSLISLASCSKEDGKPDPPAIVYDYKDFQSIQELMEAFHTISAVNEDTVRTRRLNALWDSLKVNRKIPFAVHDSVIFLYRSSATEVRWAGDFNGWNPGNDAWKGQSIANTNVWYVKKQFPSDARLDYKIVAANEWRLDPSNAYVQYSGFGPNSELRMPDWQFPEETVLGATVVRGQFGEPQIIQSSNDNLGYQVRYRVYLPASYNELEELPVVYVTDGHEYADDRLGAMLIVLDNLIHQQKIEPVIAVFVDPRDPVSGNNRRMDEYRANHSFINFLADELVPAIDQQYKTNPSASKRMIMGTSLGGWNAAFTGLHRSDVFGLLGIHSPAFDDLILLDYINAPLLPLSVFMSTGTIYDTRLKAESMKTIMEDNGYPLLYIEVNEGHSWGNWRALIDEPLLYFFAKD